MSIYIKNLKKEVEDGNLNEIKTLIMIYLGEEYNAGTSKRKETINRIEVAKFIRIALEHYEKSVLEILFSHPIAQTMLEMQITALKFCKKACNDLRSTTGNTRHVDFVIELAHLGDPEAILSLERCGFLDKLSV